MSSGSASRIAGRLAIGTAQFGLPYGIANRHGQVSVDHAREILSAAARAGIDTLDTAIGYGDSERCLGEAGVAGWKVISKLPSLPAHVTSVAEWVERSVAESVSQLRVPHLHALLLHDPHDLLRDRGRDLRRALLDIRDRGLANAIGVSIYDPALLDDIWPSFPVNLVQAPFNVFDRRLEESGWLGRLFDSGVVIHARSVFLQGLLLLSPQHLPSRLAWAADPLDRFGAWCSAHDVSRLSACLAVPFARQEISRIVVGVERLEQLEEILAIVDAPLPVVPMSLMSRDERLIDPSRWPS